MSTEGYMLNKLSDSFRKAISEEMERQHITQTRLAELSGVSRGFLNEFLNGSQTISLDKLDLILNALRLDPVRVFKESKISIKDALAVIIKALREYEENPYRQIPQDVLDALVKYASEGRYDDLLEIKTILGLDVSDALNRALNRMSESSSIDKEKPVSSNRKK